MLELTSRRTPWHRPNWRAGTLEIVQEMLSEALIPGTKDRTLKEMYDHMSRTLKKDEAAQSVQPQLCSALKNYGKKQGKDSFNIQLATEFFNDLQHSYLENWAEILGSEKKRISLDVEGTAKRIISHTLYRGMSPNSIYKFLEDYKQSNKRCTLSELVLQLDEREKQPLKTFTFAVPVTAAPEFLHGPSPCDPWLNASELKQWKHKHSPHTKKVQHHGGFLLSVQARDISEAAEHAQRKNMEIASRLRIGSTTRAAIASGMWSQDSGSCFPALSNRGRPGLKLQAFRRANVLHKLELGPQIRNVLAVLDASQSKDSHAGIVNGWTAIEALVVGPEEADYCGAERFAYILAASYFRTELIWIAKNYGKNMQTP